MGSAVVRLFYVPIVRRSELFYVVLRLYELTSITQVFLLSNYYSKTQFVCLYCFIKRQQFVLVRNIKIEDFHVTIVPTPKSEA